MCSWGDAGNVGELMRCLASRWQDVPSVGAAVVGAVALCGTHMPDRGCFWPVLLPCLLPWCVFVVNSNTIGTAKSDSKSQ